MTDPKAPVVDDPTNHRAIPCAICGNRFGSHNRGCAVNIRLAHEPERAKLGDTPTEPKAPVVDIDELERRANESRRHTADGWYLRDYLYNALSAARGDGSTEGPELKDAAFINAASPSAALALIAEVRELRGVSRWIACSERMPASGAEVVFIAMGRRCVGYYMTEYSERWDDLLRVDMCGDCDHHASDVVTHWMPLPSPPEESP